MELKVGSICRAINSGLGNLSWEFYDHGLIQKCLIIDDSATDPMFLERFDNYRLCKPNFSNDDMNWLLDGIDTLLLFESAYRWDIMAEARKRGIKIVFMPMHEFPPADNKADVWLCPSDLEMDLSLDGEKVRINVPVNTDRVKWRKREKAQKFIHNAGGGGIMGRNGTNELISSLKHVTSPIDLTIRSQVINYELTDSRAVMKHENLENYWELWEEGDVFILPDKFAGLSLPMQEAFASGMLIITTDRHPVNKWLPNDCLIPVYEYGIAKNAEVAIISPLDIAKVIDAWYNKDITKYSEMGKKWAEENSWESLIDRYKEILCAK